MRVQVVHEDGEVVEYEVKEIVVQTWTPPTIESDGPYAIRIKESPC